MQWKCFIDRYILHSLKIRSSHLSGWFKKQRVKKQRVQKTARQTASTARLLIIEELLFILISFKICHMLSRLCHSENWIFELYRKRGNDFWEWLHTILHFTYYNTISGVNCLCLLVGQRMGKNFKEIINLIGKNVFWTKLYAVFEHPIACKLKNLKIKSLL